MSEISVYDIVPTPKLADKLIGTSVGGVIPDVTYNFTLEELLQLFIPNIPANNLQGVLDYGNTATQDINLTGTINTTDLNVFATASILDSILSGETHITGELYDGLDSKGTAGQVLTSTGSGVEWYTIPTVIPTLQQVLTSGNTADKNIILTANITAVTATATNVVSNSSLSVNGSLKDGTASTGSTDQLLSSTGSGVRWVDMPVYNAVSPLLYNNTTKTFSIQVANSSQGGYLSNADWINFDGKQDAIVLTTAGTSGAATFVGNTLNIPVYSPDLSGYVPVSRTLTINGVTYDLSANRSWTVDAGVAEVTATAPLYSSGGAYPDISISQSNSSTDGYLSSADWLTFNSKLSSVGLLMPSAFSVANSPLTSDGTIAVTGSGTNLQYIDGTGALRTFPALTGYVPYTGATANVNLGEFGITAGYVGFDLTPTGTPTAVGTMYWDTAYRTVSLIDGDGDTTLQIGQEERILIHNGTGSALTDGQVVYVTGSTGNLPSVSLADASSETTSAATLGVVTEIIANGADGFVTVSGIVNGLNTLAFAEGDLLWLSETAGQFTNVKPIAPAHLVLIGYVIKRAGGNGSILVKIQNTQELSESSDVLISAPEIDGQGLFLQTISGVQLWRNRSIPDVLGYTPANNATLISTLSPLSGGGDLSANRTLSISQSGASADGYLSSTDWNTFNNKQVAGNYITSLTGEATGTGPGATAVTLNNASVTGKVLTGVNITGGTVLATDTMLTAFGKLQNQINGLVGSTIYQGVWDASTNTPTLTSSVGTNGFYYIVNVAGNTNLNGITDWKIGDWAIFNGGVWQKVDNTESVTSVNGFTGAVSLTTDNIAEGTTNLYFSNARARSAVSLTTTGSSGAATYNNTTGVFNIPNYGTALADYLPLAGGTLTGALVINPANTSTVGLDVASDTTRLRSDSTQPFPRQLTTTLGSGTLVKMQAAGYGAVYVTDLGFYTSSSSAINTTPNLYLTGGDNRVGINTDVPAHTLDVVGTAGVSGVLTLGSTISNGTFTYTLPGATGTLALVGGAGVGTVTSVAALTIGTTGTDLSSTVANGTTTPVITLNVPTASATNRGALSSADWTTFNGKLSPATAAATYLPLAGGTLTGALEGTTALFSGSVRTNNPSEGATGEGLIAGQSFKIDGTGATQKAVMYMVSNVLSDTYASGLTAQYANFTGDKAFGFNLNTTGGFELYIKNTSFLKVLTIANTKAATFTDTVTATSLIKTGGTSSQFLMADGSVSTGPSGGITGSLTNNYIPKATGANAIGNSQIFDNGTHVGINTTSPAYILDVNGTGRVSGILVVRNTSSTPSIWSGQFGGAITILGDNATAVRHIDLSIVDSLGALSAQGIRIVNSGNVLIGTTTDSGYKLDVNGVGRFSGALSGTSATFTNSLHLDRTGVTAATPLRFTTAGTNDWFIGQSPLGTSTSDLFFYSYGTSSSVFTLAKSTGAATFSSSVTAGSLLVSASDARIRNTDASGRLVIGNSATTTYCIFYGSTHATIPNVTSFVNNSANTLTLNANNTATFSSSVNAAGEIQSNSYIQSKLGASGTIGLGSRYQWDNNASGASQRQLAIQMNANSGLDFWYYNGSTYANTGTSLDSNGSVYAGRDFRTDGGTVKVGAGSNNYYTQMSTAYIFPYIDSYFDSVAGASYEGRIIFRTSTGGGSLSAKMSIYNNGNVLIGSTTDSGYKLDVYGKAVVRSGYMIYGGTTYTTYTSNGLWGATATPNFVGTNGQGSTYNKFSGLNGGLILGYQDNGNGLYSPAYGFEVKSTDGRPVAGIVVKAIVMKDVDTNAEPFIVYNNGAISSTNTVTATAFYESSDATIKTLIQNNYQAKGIESVVAKLYTKNGKEELGYYAQDVQGILPSAVSKGADGLLSLSYREVHTAKISALEKRVAELEQKLNLN